ncbi:MULTISPECIES: thiamine phosphate synthase [unclassified Campylobacter]|uniref:thiamine phosphate synthase n=1 Tax=unclassified Campylobacter TaxID=2593542 RepID=UPI0022EA0228|nr:MULTISPECIES: thiamine phosphate synthase [unclassified Campylobacter]MDA3043903.1 thiamine phosphate synthase [Campylobacter sp. JMF_09 ED2]MDA3045440.1 thiamine phosphate synthase [Campylobacter sp. JMF_07 ED4]MDA3064140.1 thiamine phosphate synthase [Campylobacter sp. JMF_11 EL3]MDA3071988.1 thiamine phosphate synthase [Campylobacter sp. VBCF_03 NA9]MDA3075747.1 thiamine phosphate synthase [Campylobacter sp. JMF_05 ED3]
MKITAISNLELCGSKEALKEKISRLCEAGISEIILREKNLSVSEYCALFCEVLQICERFGVRLFLHNFLDLAYELNYKFVWLPLQILEQKSNRNLAKFEKIVVSAHSINEAGLALNLGANALCLSHIFPTSCKENLEPKGLDLIKKVREFWSGEIYALGGINSSNFRSTLDAGTDNIAIMSSAMTCENEKEFVKKFKI